MAATLVCLALEADQQRSRADGRKWHTMLVPSPAGTSGVPSASAIQRPDSGRQLVAHSALSDCSRAGAGCGTSTEPKSAYPNWSPHAEVGAQKRSFLRCLAISRISARTNTAKTHSNTSELLRRFCALRILRGGGSGCCERQLDDRRVGDVNKDDSSCMVSFER